jgi:hypothetical protein
LKRGERHAETVRLHLRVYPECRVKGPTLRTRQRAHPPAERPQKLMEPGEWELRLGLDADGAK